MTPVATGFRLGLRLGEAQREREAITISSAKTADSSPSDNGGGRHNDTDGADNPTASTLPAVCACAKDRTLGSATAGLGAATISGVTHERANRLKST